MQLTKGQKAPSFRTKDIWDNEIDLTHIKNKKILLSFFRYAQCAVCQLRMVEIMRQKKNLKEQNIEVITVFQSPAESLQINIAEKIHFDFTIIADPSATLYKLYAVHPSWWRLLKTLNIQGVNRVIQSIKAGFKPGGKVEGQFHQIPADFLIDENKIILRAKYGQNVIDHIPLQEILHLV